MGAATSNQRNSTTSSSRVWDEEFCSPQWVYRDPPRSQEQIAADSEYARAFARALRSEFRASKTGPPFPGAGDEETCVPTRLPPRSEDFNDKESARSLARSITPKRSNASMPRPVDLELFDVLAPNSPVFDVDKEYLEVVVQRSAPSAITPCVPVTCDDGRPLVSESGPSRAVDEGRPSKPGFAYSHADSGSALPLFDSDPAYGDDGTPLSSTLAPGFYRSAGSGYLEVTDLGFGRWRCYYSWGETMEFEFDKPFYAGVFTREDHNKWVLDHELGNERVTMIFSEAGVDWKIDERGRVTVKDFLTRDRHALPAHPEHPPACSGGHAAHEDDPKPISPDCSLVVAPHTPILYRDQECFEHVIRRVVPDQDWPAGEFVRRPALVSRLGDKRVTSFLGEVGVGLEVNERHSATVTFDRSMLIECLAHLARRAVWDKDGLAVVKFPCYAAFHDHFTSALSTVARAFNSCRFSDLWALFSRPTPAWAYPVLPEVPSREVPDGLKPPDVLKLSGRVGDVALRCHRRRDQSSAVASAMAGVSVTTYGHV